MAEHTKFSRKRDAILTCLRGTTSHPSADWVFQQLRKDYPEMSLGTVYRNLSQCKQRGDIRSVGFVNGFERFDACTAPHDHLVCRVCGCVQDVPTLSLPEDMDQQAALRTGAQIDEHSLVFYGRCADCCAAAAEEGSHG